MGGAADLYCVHEGSNSDGRQYTDAALSWLHEQRLGWHYRLAHTYPAVPLFSYKLYSVHKRINGQGMDVLSGHPGAG